MAEILHVKPKSKWKDVKFTSFCSPNGDFDGLISFEELTDYDLLGSNNTNRNKKKKKKADKGQTNKSHKKEADKSIVDNRKDSSITNKKDEKERKRENRKKKKKLSVQKEGSTDTVIENKIQETKVKKQRNKKKMKLKKDNLKVEDLNELCVMDVKSSKGVEKDVQKKKKSTDLKQNKETGKKIKKNVQKTENMQKNENVQKNEQDSTQDKQTGKKRKRKPQSSPDKAESPKKKMKKGPVTVTNLPVQPINRSLDGMDAWKDLFVPQEVLWALRDQGFKEPTPIQSQILPSAIRDQMDIVGAAETGSGKTLAFGIPVIHFILEEKKTEKDKLLSLEVNNEESGNESMTIDDEDDDDDDDGEKADSDDSGDSHNSESDGGDDDDEDGDGNVDADGDLDMNIGGDDDSGVSDAVADAHNVDDEDQGSSSEEELGELQEDGTGCVKVIKDVDFSWLESELVPNPPLLVNKPRRTYPRALILEPTRELAIQVKNHLIAAAKYTDVRIAAIVGGLSLEKQRRILKKCPDLLVATPGRLWELVQEGEVFLSEIEKTAYVVIDEADRMIEKGHFEELAKLLERMKKSGDRENRHTYVFSATLTMVHSGPQRILKKKRKKKFDEKQKLVYLMRKMGLKVKPKIVDITRKIGTVETLTEARINCTKEEKDIYMYYFLKQYPGRTLVFTNSKDCIRRLVSIFSLLQCQPLPLHADMHQRQRLKNLDRFTANPNGLLMASDVAARGLDIPNVQHVIHYQVPHTVENYVHRSGRTARASKEGLSVMIIGPDDVKNYRKIINTLNRNEDLPMFPTEQEVLPEIRRRVNIVREIETQEYRFNKKKRHNDWFTKAAEEIGVDIEDEGLLDDIGDDIQQSKQRQYLKQMKHELSIMVKQPVLARSTYSKYPTKTGKLVSFSNKDSQADALDSVKKIKKAEKIVTTSEPTEEKKELSRSQKRRQQRKEKWKKKKQENKTEDDASEPTL